MSIVLNVKLYLFQFFHQLNLFSMIVDFDWMLLLYVLVIQYVNLDVEYNYEQKKSINILKKKFLFTEHQDKYFPDSYYC
jgi:hypothetical protein